MSETAHHLPLAVWVIIVIAIGLIFFILNRIKIGGDDDSN
jgi:hypothetical protein